MLHLLISCWFPWDFGEVGGGNPFLKLSMIPEKAHREGFLAAYISGHWASGQPPLPHGKEGKECKAHSKSRLLSLFREADCFTLAGQAHAGTAFGFPLERKPWLWGLRVLKGAVEISRFSHSLPLFSETAKPVLRIMTNVSSNRLLPSVSGRRQPRALATATGNS